MTNVTDRSKRAKKRTSSNETAPIPETKGKRRQPKPGESTDATSPLVLAHPLAMRIDGAILLRVEHFGDAPLEGRELWTGVVLSKSEFNLLRARADHFAQETAAMIVGGLKEK